VKQILLGIRRKTDITTQAIAERARLPITDVFVVETGGFPSRETAQRVVTAFNQRESECELCWKTSKYRVEGMDTEIWGVQCSDLS
jgi:hypothetical protein